MAKGYGGSFHKNKKVVRQRNLIQGNGQHFCEYCGRKNLQTVVEGLNNFATIDHFIPLSRGGTHAQSNLKVVCYECNQEKRDELPETFFNSDYFSTLHRRTRRVS